MANIENREGYSFLLCSKSMGFGEGLPTWKNEWNESQRKVIAEVH